MNNFWYSFDFLGERVEYQFESDWKSLPPISWIRSAKFFIDSFRNHLNRFFYYTNSPGFQCLLCCNLDFVEIRYVFLESILFILLGLQCSLFWSIPFNLSEFFTFVMMFINVVSWLDKRLSNVSFIKTFFTVISFELYTGWFLFVYLLQLRFLKWWAIWKRWFLDML